MTQPVPFKDDVLREALGLIESDRQIEYGTPGQNFGRWSRVCHELGFDLSPGDLALIMAAGKLARLGNRKAILKRDNFVDLAGYSSIAVHLYGDAVV
jgi:hypothetical protein